MPVGLGPPMRPAIDHASRLGAPQERELPSEQSRYKSSTWDRRRIQSAYGRRVTWVDLARSSRRKLRSALASDADRGWIVEIFLRCESSRRARRIPTSADWTLARSGRRKSPKATASVMRKGAWRFLLLSRMRSFRAVRACWTLSGVKRDGLAPDTVSPAGVVIHCCSPRAAPRLRAGPPSRAGWT